MKVIPLIFTVTINLFHLFFSLYNHVFVGMYVTFNIQALCNMSRSNWGNILCYLLRKKLNSSLYIGSHLYFSPYSQQVMNNGSTLTYLLKNIPTKISTCFLSRYELSSFYKSLKCLKVACNVTSEMTIHYPVHLVKSKIIF